MIILLPQLQEIIDRALAEDFGPAGYPAGDVTTQALLPPGMKARMALVAREKLVMAGGAVAAQVFRTLEPAMEIEIAIEDGAVCEAGMALLTAHGPAAPLLSGERVALNLLQRMCGVATLTRAYADAVSGTRAVILDTRKTLPGLRLLDKYAVTCGGGANHRMGLYDAAMIKDNHVALAGGVAEAVFRTRAGTDRPVILECDTLSQVEEGLAAKPDRLLLDNMPPALLREAVRLAAGRLPLEASGGVNLDTVRAIAETGVDFISVGALTHSARAVDIGADILFK